MGTAILLELVRTFSSMVSNGKVRAWAGQLGLWPEPAQGREAGGHRLEGGQADLGSKPSFLTSQLAPDKSLLLFPAANRRVELALEQHQGRGR